MENYQPINDGVDHINVYSKGQTKLGRDLSNFADIPVTVSGQGTFASLEGYWYWLSTGMCNDTLRTLVGYNARKYGRGLQKVMLPQETFRGMIKNAISNKIVLNPTLMAAVRNSTLPFAHYYWYGTVDNPKVIYLPEFQWMMDQITYVRKTLQATTQTVWYKS